MTSSTMKDDLSYVPGDSFETFPHPCSAWDRSATELITAGEQYYSFREVLRTRGSGLTTLYNSFHNPDENDPNILRLRELHAAMDRAVLDAYHWADIRPTYEFLLDYEEDEDKVESVGARGKKKPWRYRWPDDVRDKVLARLLELNAQRAKEQTGTPPPSGGPNPTASGGSDAKLRGRVKGIKKAQAKSQGNLFSSEDE
jgi:hypothetical protein